MWSFTPDSAVTPDSSVSLLVIYLGEVKVQICKTVFNTVLHYYV